MQPVHARLRLLVVDDLPRRLKDSLERAADRGTPDNLPIEMRQIRDRASDLQRRRPSLRLLRWLRRHI
jgi:hypothetical protein